MAKYRVQKCAYVWYTVEVEAKDEQEAEEKGGELLDNGHHADEEFGDWSGGDVYVDEIEEFVYVPTPSPTAEEPDLIY
jgi:hypothetical protein